MFMCLEYIHSERAIANRPKIDNAHVCEASLAFLVRMGRAMAHL